MISNLRAILCNSEAKWKIKNFDHPPPPPAYLPQILHAIRYCGGMSKNSLCSGCYFIVVTETPIVCWCMAKNLIFNSETVVKSAKCVALFLKSIKTLQPKTFFFFLITFIAYNTSNDNTYIYMEEK